MRGEEKEIVLKIMKKFISVKEGGRSKGEPANV